MKPERSKEIEKLYNAAIERGPSQRAAFLAKACAGDASLRAEVESLLAHGKQAGGFMEASAMQTVAQELAANSMPSKKGEILPNDPPPDEEAPRHPRKRAPWWMYAIAAAFLICAAARYYVSFAVPIQSFGFKAQPVKDKNGKLIAYLIKTVLPESAFAEAGLQAGDIIEFGKSDGYFPTPNQPNSGPYYWTAGRPYRFEIKRKEEIKIIFVTPKRASWRVRMTAPNYRPALASLLAAFLELALAVIIAFRRPYDIAARWGALFLGIIAIVAIYGIGTVAGVYSIVLSFPRIIRWLVALLPDFCSGSLTSVGLTFASIFPRRLFRRRWIWILIWAPTVMGVPWYVFRDHPPIYPFPQWCPDWYSSLAKIIGSAAWCAVAVVLVLNYRRLPNLNDRRRVRTIVAGVAITLIGYTPYVATLALPNWLFLRRLLGPPYNFSLVLSCLGCALPISMAYAILRHRVFDIRVMIRLGLRYAAARGVLLSLVPIIAVILAGDLLLHGNQPLVQILGQRGLLYAALAGGAFLLHIRRRVWLDAIDRRFFRERYDAQRVLHAVVDDIRAARSFEKVAPYVVSQVEAALHPEFAALLIRRPGDLKYRVLAAKEIAPPPIPADSKLIGLVRLLGKPVEISQSQTGWLRSQLPQQESEFLRQAHLEWLFPICLAEGQTEALLAMGPKRSEEPYSREDQELLQGITSSLAMLLEQSPSLAPVHEGFEECPQCGICYDTGSGSCKKEGAKLISLSFPRLLDYRYRFEQRLGEGGMGTVYQAFDTELERQVAVKLIRSDLTASAEAAARFRQEAKAAASFAHPNVVTVHDFGVAAGQRAYLVMELLRGLTLRQELSHKGRLPAPRASQVMRDVCVAVEAAHQRRLLHRDLKPENIFLVNAANAETAKILDFGVVKPIALTDTTMSVGQTGPGMLVGTLKYMSPEQLRGENPAESWDIWALSVVAYEILTGVHPFSGTTVLDLHNEILAGRVTQLCKHLPEAPKSWQLFFDRALSNSVKLRPDSALKLYSEFTQNIH